MMVVNKQVVSSGWQLVSCKRLPPKTRMWTLLRLSKKQTLGLNVLYFGCKKVSHDYLYKDEMAKLQSDGVLNKLCVAYSREQPEKVYVPKAIAHHAIDATRTQ